MIKMKALSLPISSPSRAAAAADKSTAPAQPLMRFLSGNVLVSRSRARSRGSSIFGKIKNNRILMNNEATQEPSSPRVTCIGQVRSRRATSDSALNPGHRRRRWWWWKKPLFCYRFRRYRDFRGLLSRWVLCSTNGYGKKVDAREDIIHSFVVESEDFQAKVQEIAPSNALSLTRCKSVPRRSSSYLVGRIWEATPESCERGVLKNENEQNFQEFTSLSSEIIHESHKENNVVEDLNGIVGVAAAHPYRSQDHASDLDHQELFDPTID